MAKAEKEKHVLDDQPLNAEEPVNKLVDSFITPSSKLFDRNHGEVPQIDAATHRVYFEAEDDLGLEGFSLGMPDLYRAGNSEVIAALQCAGNRRSEMAGLSGLGETEGLPWVRQTVSAMNSARERLTCLNREAELSGESNRVTSNPKITLA